MKKTIICFSVLATLLHLHATAHAGEAFQAMKRQFCTPLSGNEEAVALCQTYWNLRICYGQSREEAFSQCRNICSNKYGSGTTSGTTCQAYCQNMWTRDN